MTLTLTRHDTVCNLGRSCYDLYALYRITRIHFRTSSLINIIVVIVSSSPQRWLLPLAAVIYRTGLDPCEDYHSYSTHRYNERHNHAHLAQFSFLLLHRFCRKARYCARSHIRGSPKNHGVPFLCDHFIHFPFFSRLSFHLTFFTLLLSLKTAHVPHFTPTI